MITYLPLNYDTSVVLRNIFEVTCTFNGRRFTKSALRILLLSTFRVSSTNYFLVCSLPIHTESSANVDRPARRSASAHAKYTISHHVLIKQFLLLGLAAEHRSCRWVGGCESCDKRCRRPSDVYDTYRRTKLTAPGTISRSRDTVCALQI